MENVNFLYIVIFSFRFKSIEWYRLDAITSETEKRQMRPQSFKVIPVQFWMKLWPTKCHCELVHVEFHLEYKGEEE